MTIPREGWFTSSWSKDNADCVEVKLDVEIGVRDTKAREDGQLNLEPTAWGALLRHLR